ncbi:MAG: hypothetical protein HAW66_07260 [Shewanella sp.]|nr:hypothetical protein [Shewanella sp.]
MDLLPSILKENNKDVISAYFSNKHLPEEILKSLYKRKTPFNEFSDENWVSLCFYTANNPRITTPPESELFPDNALDYMRVINLAWKLFEIFPVSYHSADVLFHLAKNLVPPRFVNIDFELIINRWQGESSEKEDEFFYARYAYANHIQDYDSLFKSLKESDDLALRCAYYRNKSYSKVEDILNDATKDGSKFLDEVFGNRHIFQSETTRNALHSAVKNIGELAPNEAGWYMGEHWRALSFWEKKYPEWFEDGVGDAGLQSFNTVMSKTKRTEKQIGYLTSAIKKIDKKLSVELDDSESLIGIGEYCERKFETINQALQKMNQKLNSGATFFIFGLVIGHFIFS